MSLSQLTSTVQEILPDTTLREAARLMAHNSIGALLICKERGGALEGILTDRDIVKEIAVGSDPDKTTVAGFLDRPVKTLPDGVTRREITSAMHTHGVRRIPLLDKRGRATRIVSMDDLLVESGEELFDIARAIRIEFRNEAPDPDPMD
jgi:CBS domain-containing protein